MEAFAIPLLFQLATVTSVTAWTSLPSAGGSGHYWGIADLRALLTPDAHQLVTCSRWFYEATRGHRSLCDRDFPRGSCRDGKAAGGSSYTSAVQGAGERLGVFGGTFDPPHIGHLVAASEARQALGLDRVLLVVANEPWQKTGTRPISPAADRLAMVKAAVVGVEGLEASAIELEQGGPSYTADTLETLAARDPEGTRFLILGADAAAGLTTWERADAVPRLATLVVLDRPGLSAPAPPAGWAFERVEMPRLDVSSTDLRDRVAAGRPLTFLTPDEVVSCIRDRRLYRGRP